MCAFQQLADAGVVGREQQVDVIAEPHAHAGERRHAEDVANAARGGDERGGPAHTAASCDPPISS